MPFCVVLAGDLPQRKVERLFHGLPNMFGIVDDIFISGFNDMG